MDSQNHVSTALRPLSPGKAAIRDAAEVLGERGTLSLMIATLLFCLVASFAVYFFLIAVGSLFLLFDLSEGGAALLSLTVDLLLPVLLAFLALPLWFGRWRMAGLLLRGERPAMGEIFYYYTSSLRYRRALYLAILLVLLLLAPALFGVMLYGVVTSLYYRFLLAGMATLLARCLLILLGACAVAAWLLAVSFTGGFLLAFGVALGNERMPLPVALKHALAAGRGNFLAIAGFSLCHIPRFLLGLAVVGVLNLLWHCHLYTLSYLRLAMALAQKEESRYEQQ